MAERYTEKDVREAAAAAGLLVKTNSPGDGVTRYRFFVALGAAPNQSYWGPANGIYTALGAKEAMAFVWGRASH